MNSVLWAGDDLSFAACCEAAMRRRARCHHKETEMLSNSATFKLSSADTKRPPLQTADTGRIDRCRFDMSCVTRRLLLNLGWNEGLFDFLLPSYDSTSTDLLLKGYFLIFGPLSVNPRDGYVGNSQQCLSATNNSQCLPPLIPGVAAM